jgi:hypothetical protein
MPCLTYYRRAVSFSVAVLVASVHDIDKSDACFALRFPRLEKIASFAEHRARSFFKSWPLLTDCSDVIHLTANSSHLSYSRRQYLTNVELLADQPEETQGGIL